MGLFLGIDGGSTKTNATVIDEKGKVLLQARDHGSNYYALGVTRAENNLYALLKSVMKKLRKKKLKLSGVCFGIAGVDSRKEYNIVYSSIKRRMSRLLKCRFMLVNDVNIILPTVTDNGKGVAVIGGTGSNFYAINGKKEARASGLGHILSDEGGANYIGNRVLRAAVQSYDGRGKKSVLEKLVLKRAGIKNVRDLKDKIPDIGDAKVVADYAPLAEIAMKKGDSGARDILNKAVEENTKGIMAVSKRLGLKGGFDIAFVGSAFNSEYLLKNVKKHVRAYAPKARFHIVKNSSLGAAHLAAKKFGR